MKRCGFCNDVLMKDSDTYTNGDTIECFVCGTKYKVKLEWKTDFDRNGMFRTELVPKLISL